MEAKSVHVHEFTSGTTTAPILPYDKRHYSISYRSSMNEVGETAYPINYEELYNLKGRLLTIIDATFTDPQQRKAQKDIFWQALRSWMEDIQRACGEEPLGESTQAWASTPTE